jgi:Rhodopirellula transposase DDE domain
VPVITRVRSPGGARKALTESEPGLWAVMKGSVEPMSRQHPRLTVRWTCPAQLAAELMRKAHPVIPQTVGSLLKAAGYSLQNIRKTEEGSLPPDPNAQFQFINAAVERFQQRGQPMISVGTKKNEEKNELIGQLSDSGQEWRPQREPEEVRVHDFMDKTPDKATPRDVYDLNENEGWFSFSVDHNSARFAVQAITRRWQKMGARRHPRAPELMIMPAGGSSNRTGSRAWKVAPRVLANPVGMPIHVRHLPPGKQQWNNIEDRMLCHIIQLLQPTTYQRCSRQIDWNCRLGRHLASTELPVGSCP